MLTFAGEPLLFPGRLGPESKDTPKLPFKVWNRLDEWLKYHYDLDDLRLWGGTESRLASGRHSRRSRGEINKGIGLPVVNWPDAPPLRLNQLYWPTGATRWACGLFLCTKAVKDKIVAKSYPGSTHVAQTLGFGDDLDGNPLTPVNAVSMYLLTPRPVTKSRLYPSEDEGDVTDLWLIPLVDERYFWQCRSFGDNTVTTSTSWANLFSTLGTQLGTTISVQSSIEAAYLKPDPIDFSRRFDNAALMADAAAWSVGRRIVRKIDGSVICQSSSIANSQLFPNLNTNTTQLAGGDFNIKRGDQPSAITVTFRKIKQYLLQENGKLYTVDKTLTSSLVPTISGTKLVIHCAAYADYNTSDALQNGTAMGDLAEQIKTDYLSWAGYDYDHTFPGIIDWKPTGYDDAILWKFGALCDGQIQAQTRVWTLPGNVWPEINLCSDSTKEIVEPRMMAIADADIAAGAEGTVSLYDSFTNDTTKNVTARNISGIEWSSGNRGSVMGIGDAVWIGGPSECADP
jgi:hypothetical protein